MNRGNFLICKKKTELQHDASSSNNDYIITLGGGGAPVPPSLSESDRAWVTRWWPPPCVPALFTVGAAFFVGLGFCLAGALDVEASGSGGTIAP